MKNDGGRAPKGKEGRRLRALDFFHRGGMSFIVKAFQIARLYPLHFFSFGKGDGWLEEVTAYLKNNRDLFIRLVQEKNLPIVPLKPEAGFLFWIDCRKSGIEPEHLGKTIMEKAGVSLNNGLDHGEDGRGFIRLNFGVTEKTLREAADRLKKVF